MYHHPRPRDPSQTQTSLGFSCTERPSGKQTKNFKNWHKDSAGNQNHSNEDVTRCALCKVFLHFPALKVLRSTNGGPSTSTQHCMAVIACHNLLAAPHQERNLSWRFFVLLQWLKSWNWNIFLERTQPFKPTHASVSSTSFEPRAFDELRSLQSWGHEPWMYVWIAPVCMYNHVSVRCKHHKKLHVSPVHLNLTRSWCACSRICCFSILSFHTYVQLQETVGGSFSSWPILGLYLHRVKTSKDRPSRAPREAEWKEYRAAALQRSSWIYRHKLQQIAELAKQRVSSRFGPFRNVQSSKWPFGSHCLNA